MKYKLLGRSGLKVSELCLGTMGFGTENGWGADKETSKQVFDTYVNAGGNFLDTANGICVLKNAPGAAAAWQTGRKTPVAPLHPYPKHRYTLH